MNRYLILCGRQYIRLGVGGEPVYGTCIVVNRLDEATRLDKRQADRYMAGASRPGLVTVTVFSVREAG
jgi:hypothetical protein